MKAASGVKVRSLISVRSAAGVVRRDRGQLLIDLRVSLEPRCDLSAVADAVDRTSTVLARCLERPDLYCRVRLDVAGRSREAARRVD